ncbi:MAG: complex I NDUFA9 subunit family protein [Alphaproteobacteria bacterium]|nr:complex I NDUFA9 subunit family protein [Alphaproteobacteria bacterium]
MTTGRRITVFGGSGFVGQYVVRRLAQQGWIIRVATRDPVVASQLKPLGNVGQIVPMRVDVRDPAAVETAVNGADAVVNLVAVLYESGVQTFRALHVEAAGRIAAAAAKAGATRFVQVSSIGADPAAASAYARTKAEGERAVLAAFPAATIIRPSIVIGPEDGFFNRFARMALMSPVLPLIGGGHTRFQPVFVGDLAEAITRALADPAAAGRIYEIGGPRVYSFRELMEIMLAEIGRSRMLVSVPFKLAELKGAILQHLPGPKLLTRDQVILLKQDNVVHQGVPGLAELGVPATPIEAIIPTYLDIYRRGGRFAGRPA